MFSHSVTSREEGKHYCPIVTFGTRAECILHQISFKNVVEHYFWGSMTAGSATDLRPSPSSHTALNNYVPFIFSVKEFMDFTSKIVVERTGISQRASVKEQGMYECNVSVASNRFCRDNNRLLLSRLNDLRHRWRVAEIAGQTKHFVPRRPVAVPCFCLDKLIEFESTPESFLHDCRVHVPHIRPK